MLLIFVSKIARNGGRDKNSIHKIKSPVRRYLFAFFRGLIKEILWGKERKAGGILRIFREE